MTISREKPIPTKNYKHPFIYSDIPCWLFAHYLFINCHLLIHSLVYKEMRQDWYVLFWSRTRSIKWRSCMLKVYHSGETCKFSCLYFNPEFLLPRIRSQSPSNTKVTLQSESLNFVNLKEKSVFDLYIILFYVFFFFLEEITHQLTCCLEQVSGWHVSSLFLPSLKSLHPPTLWGNLGKFDCSD